ncbi:MAG: type II toxin-antitoxin system HipA family toxin [Crocinitomicaceae bacterium]|jgi:serine/threonine-protein kinase HipA|nr:type II toxin-antitoxin system HipA family toxin [Crocinitomicaceae bacterium]
MAQNQIIEVHCFGEEIGRLGLDENQGTSSFQYHPDYLASGNMKNLFPSTGVLKRMEPAQIFNQFNSETFRGLPPMFADSLPDYFGNVVFQKWMEINAKNDQSVSVLEQLSYVANRGMGALEFRPSRRLTKSTTIDLTEVLEVLKEVLDQKESLSENQFEHQALLNIFKMGSSAGGARPKLLISEHKNTGRIIPGDVHVSDDYFHYLIKLSLDDSVAYSKEVLEYAYYLTATEIGIHMMPSKLVDEKHFATQRFDRVNGQKIHTLTASGLTGWDFQKPTHSSYENLFELALFLKVPRRDLEELYRRMVFNVGFGNSDDHLKNHSFSYDEVSDSWSLSPAYDLTYSLNPMLTYKRTSRALSINQKRVDISRKDLLKIADTYTIKNPKAVIDQVQNGLEFLENQLKILPIPGPVIGMLMKSLKEFQL